MEIVLWGCRGGIPVSGREYVEFGGNTPCIQVKTPQTEFIIDAGTGIRELGNMASIQEKKNFNFLFTHVHWDHILGLPFFRPIYEGANLEIFYNFQVQGDVVEYILDLFRKPYFPVEKQEVESRFISRPVDFPFKKEDLEIEAIPLSHPDSGLGYKFKYNGKTFVYLTDNELEFNHINSKSYEEYLEFCFSADLLIHDAEYLSQEYKRTKGWGHSRMEAVLEFAFKAKVKSLGLFHHSQNRKDNELLELERSFQLLGKSKGLHIFMTRQGQSLML
ncbi:MBL fold metallo-hydrolase [Desulfonauticus submarinus]